MLHGKEICIIVAMDDYRLIGKNGGLPWPRIREDMSRFETLTTPHSLIMGRKTWESLPEKLRPLKNRQSIVLSRNDYPSPAPDVIVTSSFDTAVLASRSDKVFVIGGEAIYREALPFADTLYITHVHGNWSGNVYFPQYDKSQWKIGTCTRVTADTATRQIHIDFCTYTRLQNQNAAP